MTGENERAYFQRRALQELQMTLRADSIEAERAHNTLTGKYLAHCMACTDGIDTECGACPLRTACALLVGVAAPALARALLQRSARHPPARVKPGPITDTADDDPSSIATYSQG